MPNDTINTISKEILGLAPEIQNEILVGFKHAKAGDHVEHEGFAPNAQDLTTALDHKIGQIYIDKIFKRHSDKLTIDSEEEDERLGNGSITMRFDPLEGTKYFYKGIPMLGSTVTLIENGVTQFGMVINVFSNDTYHAFSNGGAFLNGNKIETGTNSIADDFSFVFYEGPNSKLFSKDAEKFKLFSMMRTAIAEKSFRMRDFGLSALPICLVADGSAPAYVDFSASTKLYDVEAPALIALEAGAIVGDTNGNKSNNLDHSEEGVKKLTGNLLVANPIAFDEMSKLLEGTS